MAKEFSPRQIKERSGAFELIGGAALFPIPIIAALATQRIEPLLFELPALALMGHGFHRLDNLPRIDVFDPGKNDQLETPKTS